ncbi:hypothetical protein B0H19DRAFT_315757 [Mycena capillaripes]|nr:hypothetical protein B0H19DRAFT_315757 [Mycena capillaripes]
MEIHCNVCEFVSDHPSMSPALEHLLETNNPPHDSNVLDLHAIILEHRRHIAHLDAKFNCVRYPTELVKLVLERDELMARVVECAAVFAPVRRLPPELLCQIFMATIASRDIRTRWTLVLVCRIWRAVALSFPALWSLVVVHSKSLAPQIEAQLVRSKATPLDMVLMDIWDESKIHLFDVVANYSFQWQTADLSRASEMFERLERVKGRIPILKDLRIRCVDMHHDLPPRLGDTFALAPSLITAHVQFHCGYSPSQEVLPLPFHQLQAYSGHRYAPVENHLSALRPAVAILVDLSLTSRGPYYVDFDAEQLELSSLARLSVSNTQFLHYLVTPSLRELYVVKSLDPAVSLLHRSACKLIKLVCYECIDAKALIDVVRACDSIKELYIAYCGSNLDKFVSLLAGEDDAAPNLETFSIVEDDGDNLYLPEPPSPVDTDTFLGMIKARWKKGRLRSGTLASFNHSFSPICLAAFASLQHKGFDFKCLGREIPSTVRKVFCGWCPEDLYIPDIFTADA